MALDNSSASPCPIEGQEKEGQRQEKEVSIIHS
jgi:hypothetical protein